MRPLGRLASLCMVLASTAAFAAPPIPPKADVPPPPGLNDPGVTATSPTKANDVAPPPAPADADPLAPLPKPDTRPVRDKAARGQANTAERVAASEMTTRQEGSDTIEEYRQNGRVWMVRVKPQNGGPMQTFMDTTGSGRLTNDPQQGPVSPVIYSLYEWN